MAKNTHNKTILQKVLSSKWFFIAIIVFFVFQTGWIALSTSYPMIFDEEYHLGIIDIYSRQISPFITTQPAEAAFHGDITRYGSYLFHYLMSFPYRLIHLFTSDLQTIVIIMRFLCIGFVLLGLYMFRQFALRAGVSKAVTHTAIAVFTLIPLVPFALSQINYDSLAFLCIATIFYLVVRSIEPSKRQVVWFSLLIALSCFASLVKFTILPIAFTGVVFVLVYFWKKHGKKTFHILFNQGRKLPKITGLLLVLIVVLGLGLFSERYAVNIVKYKAVEPKCHKVHSVESCIQYTVWRRDTTWKQNNDAKNIKRNDPIVYTTTYWAPHIFADSTVVAAFADKQNKVDQIRYLPNGSTMQGSPGTPTLQYASIVMAILSLMVLIFTWKKIHQRVFKYLVISSLVVYATSLWVRNYTDYLSIGAGTAAQGRYFIPFLIPIFILFCLGWSILLKKQHQRATILIISVLLLSQGGGVANYMLYSNKNWYFPQQQQSIEATNNSAKSFLKTFTIFK